MVLAGERIRCRDHFGRNFRDDRAIDRMCQRRAECHAAAEADDVDTARVVVQQQRQVGEQLLRQHVPAGRGVHLAVDRQ